MKATLSGLFFISMLLQMNVAWGQEFGFEDVTSTKDFQFALSGDTHGSGIAAADFDSDGDIDLYVCTASGYPDYLYRNDGGTFNSIGSEVGLASTLRSRMALWLDIDGDTQLDLLVSGDCDFDNEDCPESSFTRLYHQVDGSFVDISSSAGLDDFGPKEKDQALGGLAAADINNDGYIDFVQMVRNGSIEVFINQKNLTFIESADEMDFDTDEFKFYQPFFHDFTKDGYLDLYYNVDFGENQFWINSASSTFENQARLTASNNAFNEMGISLGDFDRDGDFDIYATNIANYLGQDVYNILLKQEPGLSSDVFFTEVARDFQLDQGGWGWGVTFFDANNDGFLDLATTNGWDLPFEVIDQSKIWLQLPNGTFSDQSVNLGFDDELNAATLISIDYDRDGDLDMIQSVKGYEEEQVPFRLLENNISTDERGNYIVIKPRMLGDNHYAIGAVVRAYVEDVPYGRIIHAGTSFYGQEPAEAFIGVGATNTIDSVSITWPGGEESWHYDLSVNEIIEINDDEVVHRPSGLAISQIGADAVLSWNDMSHNETGFLIQWSTFIDFESFEEFLSEPNLTEFRNTNVEDATYYYRIKSIAENLESRWTDFVEIDYLVLNVNKDFSDQISLFPNPASGHFEIKTRERIERIKVFNIQGLELEVRHEKKDENHWLVRTEQFAPGVYFVKVNNKTRKLVVY